MPDAQSRVQAIVARFVTDLTAVAREEAARVVLGGFEGPLRGRRIDAPGSTRNGRGAKRTTEGLQALQDQVVAFVKSHPGLRIEQINAELGTSTKDLALPIRKLVASKQLRTEGRRRSTKYFVRGAGAVERAATPNKKAKRRMKSKR
jgi:hypothetical protein